MAQETYVVTNGKNTMTLHDSNQLSAFLNNGWTEKKAKPAETAEKVTLERPVRRKAVQKDE